MTRRPGLIQSWWSYQWISEIVGLDTRFSTAIVRRCISLHSTNSSISWGFKANFGAALASPSTPQMSLLQHQQLPAQAKEQIVTRKTNVDQPPATDHKDGRCPIHNTRHQLADCKVFLQKVIPQRREILKKSGLCFRCLKRGHCRSDCKECCLRILR